MDNKEIEKKKKLKKRGAIISGGIIALYYTIFAFAVAVGGVEIGNPLTAIIFALVPLIFGVLVIKVTMDRINEIDGGEEDDISKY